MDKLDVIQSAGFSLPLWSALVCLILMLMYYPKTDGVIQRRLIGLMAFTYFTALCCWTGVVLYILDYDGFVWFRTPFLFALMVNQVLLHHFVFRITDTGSDRRFSLAHYVMPVVIISIYVIWSLFVPYEVRYHLVESRGQFHPDYLWYSRYFLALPLIFVVYSIVYSILSFVKVRDYRKAVVDYSADERRSSAIWLYQLILLIWLTLPFAAGLLFMGRSIYFRTFLAVGLGFLPIFQYLVIAYNLLADNYVIILKSSVAENEEEGTRKIDRLKFEQYMKAKKPFLNSRLKITEMCLELGTNRTYLSSFINREYGVNFSRFINQQRMKELDRIRIEPSNKDLQANELILMAGFSNYGSYLRVKKMEDREKARLF